MQDLVPWPGIEPGAPALGARSLTHWTTKEVPKVILTKRKKNRKNCVTLLLKTFQWPPSELELNSQLLTLASRSHKTWPSPLSNQCHLCLSSRSQQHWGQVFPVWEGRIFVLPSHPLSVPYSPHYSLPSYSAWFLCRVHLNFYVFSSHLPTFSLPN